MDAVPECEVTGVVAVVVDEPGASEAVRVAVGGSQGHEDELVRGEVRW